MIMAEDIITTDTAPTVHTDGGFTHIRSDAEIKEDWPYAVSIVFPNPTYEAGCSPKNDADSSVPVQNKTTNSDPNYVQNTDERLTNPRYLANDVSIGYEENDDENHMFDTTDTKGDTKIASVDVEVHPSTDESIYHNDIVSSKSDRNPSSKQNSGYTTGIRRSNSCNSIYEKARATKTTNTDDNGKNVTPKDDIYTEIPEQVDQEDDANQDPTLPYAVSYEFANPSYMSDSKLTEHDADKVVPENDTNDMPQNRQVPSTDPNSIRDALNRNPMYVPHVPQQGRCHVDLLIPRSVWGTVNAQAPVDFSRRACSCSPMTGPAAGSRRLLSASLLVFTDDCPAADSRRLLSANQLVFTDGWICRRLPSTSLGEPARVHR
uniref:Uncharacterized protein n=1 Tax=Branchiostoma floridae TaxID=7739 RepID=C3YVR1_BRAFL|eukprot:XP_002599583.1 hypothetical protein BRAFLDRAFT_77683 [Branchiostoma floridae]